MIKDNQRQVIRAVIITIAIAALVGWLTGFLFEVLTLTLASHLVWNLWQQSRLFRWLRQPRTRDLPEAVGLWGSVFDYLYSLKRQHAREVNRLQTVVKRVQKSTAALEDGVMMMDRNGAMDWWNDSAADMLNLRDQDHGQLITNFVRDPAFNKFFFRAKSRTSITLQSPYRPHIHLNFAVTLFGENEVLMIVRDVSRIKKLEQMRQDFVANASHELRTPLTVVHGYLESFLDFGENIPEPMKKGLKQMQAQTIRMNSLVSDLMLLTRLDTEDQPKPTGRVRIDQLLATIVEDARALSGEANHIFVLDHADNLDLTGEESQIRSAFSNLVFNAVHYTPAGGTITLSWKNDQYGIYFSVQDTGIGIESRHISRLTERFYRVDVSRSTSTGGTGLGLAIVKHVLQNHNGRLDISSSPGKGSTFTCRFPSAQIWQFEDPVSHSDIAG